MRVVSSSAGRVVDGLYVGIYQSNGIYDAPSQQLTPRSRGTRKSGSLRDECRLTAVPAQLK